MCQNGHGVLVAPLADVCPRITYASHTSAALSPMRVRRKEGARRNRRRKEQGGRAGGAEKDEASEEDEEEKHSFYVTLNPSGGQVEEEGMWREPSGVSRT